jgi:hypothetical protein
MWTANILLGLFGVYLTLRMGRENTTINWSSLRRLIPTSWRSESAAPELHP